MEDEGVWLWTRICFYSLLMFWGIAMMLPLEFFETVLGGIISLLAGLTGIATIVLSIIHLVKLPQKGLAVTALTISTIFMFFYMVGAIAGLLEVV